MLRKASRFIAASLKRFWSGDSLRVFCAFFAGIIIFDLLWCAQTTFRAMSSAMLYTNNIGAALVLTLPFLLVRRRWVAATVMLLADLQMIAVLMYCRTYFSAIPYESYFMAGNLADFLPSVADSFSFRYLNVLWPLAWLLLRRGERRRGPKLPVITGWLISLAVVSAASLGLMAAKGGFLKSYAAMKNSCYYSSCTTPVYTLYGDLVYDRASRSAKPSQADLEQIGEWLDEHNRLAPYEPLDPATGIRTNLVVILCESLESWVVGAEAEGHVITPCLNSLIADSTTLYCPNVVTQVGPGRSIDCQLLVNAGMLPMINDVYSMTFSESRYHTLNQAMSEKYGARSLILTCDKPVTWNQAPIAMSFGIDSLLDKSSWRNDESVGNPPKLSDGSFMRQTVEKLKAGEIWPESENIFMQIITYSGHNPFRLPEQLKTLRFSDAMPERLADYMMMANYTDRSLSTLIEYLKTRPDYDRTVIVITGDHEGLADSRATLRETPQGRELVSPWQLTPLIVVNSPVGGRYDKPIGQVDIYPTLLNLMRLDSFRWKGIGESLFSPSNTGWAIATLTGETVGDTLATDPRMSALKRSAREISDKMIRFNYFASDSICGR